MRKGVGRNSIGIAGPSGAARHTGGRPSCRSGKTVMALCAEAADDNLRRRRGKRRKMLLRAETFFLRNVCYHRISPHCKNENEVVV